MELVAVYRLRRIAGWYIGATVLCGIALMLAAFGGGIEINGGRIEHGLPLHASSLTGIAMVAASIWASNVGIGLNREAGSLDLTWTKPLSRFAIGVRYAAVDAAAIVAFYLFVIAVELVLALVVGARPVIDGDLGPALALGAAIALMWYGLTSLVTARLPGWGPAAAGILWPVATLIIAIASAKRDTPLRRIAEALDLLNPLAYTTLVRGGGDAPIAALNVLTLPRLERAGIATLLAALFVAAAVALWSRREAR